MNDYIQFNDEERYFILSKANEKYSYDEIADYRYAEKKGSIAGGGIGRAFTAGFGSGKGTYTLKSMYISVNLKNGNILDIQFLITPTNSNTVIYKSLYKKAQDILSKFEEIAPKKEEIDAKQEDFYDELMKLKKLLDMEIITQEEFDLKKKQILNI